MVWLTRTNEKLLGVVYRGLRFQVLPDVFFFVGHVYARQEFKVA